MTNHKHARTNEESGTLSTHLETERWNRDITKWTGRDRFNKAADRSCNG
jgi:hypothetical protein